MLNTLLALSPIDGRYSAKLTPLRQSLSEYGLIRYRVFVEIQWLLFLAETEEITHVPTLPTTAIQALEEIIEHFSVDDAAAIKKIEQTTNHDVKAVEYWLKAQCENLKLNDHIEAIHFACTSEDINNLAYSLMVQESLHQCLLPTLKSILAELSHKAEQYADVSMLSRTHGQTASPTTMGKEIANFCARITATLAQIEQVPIKGKINGAVGNFNAHCIAYPEINWPSLAQQFVERLGLDYQAYTTQIEPHDELANLCMALTRVNTILIDFARDMWSYISLDYCAQKPVAGEVGSSTMPHKINPIDFENAEGNLGVANALLMHLATKLPISRWQRDLTDSTVLRNLGNAFGHSFLAYQALIKGLSKIAINQEQCTNDLSDRYEVLAEAVQTVMRCHGIEQPYEKLKALTRGHKIDQTILTQFIGEQPLPEKVKARLLALTPNNYIGLATELAKAIKS